MLMPAAVLIMILLGSIAVDFAIAFLGERELASLASAAANDAATAAYDVERYREDGTFVLDLDRAEQIVADTLGASSTEVDLEPPVIEPVTIGGDPGFRVTLRGTVAYIFARAVPGLPETTEVEASAVAVAREG
jgi:Flp pilus assembly protein TadG